MTDPESPSEPRRPTSLGERTTRGYAWMLFQTMGTQAVAFIGQIVLAWVLLEEDFGVFALVNTVATLAGLAQRIGLRTILIRRERRFHLWATPAFWISTATGTASMLLMLAFAPFFTLAYDRPGLFWFVAIVALSAPPNAMSLVPEALVQAQMRFRLLAVVRFGMVAGTLGLTVIFALVGLGPWSFVLPFPIIHTARLLLLWRAARPPVHLRPQVRRWKYLLRDATMLTGNNVATYVTTQGDYVILGIFFADAVVGVYFYAYGLSQRAFVLLTRNLRDVLFPALTKLSHDGGRQVDAFLKATRLLLLLGAPFCLLQAALAEPACNLFLRDRMPGVAPILQILSIGCVFQLVGQPAFALLRAQGRFATLLRVSIVVGVLFVGMVLGGAILANESNAGVVTGGVVGAFMLISGVGQLLIGIRPAGRGWPDLRRVFIPPLGAAIIAVGIAWSLGQLLPAGTGGDVARLLGVTALALGLYVPLARRFAPGDFEELRRRILELVARRGKRRRAALAGESAP